MAYLTAKCLHCRWVASYCPHKAPESGYSLTSWCLVDSSSHAGLPLEQIESAEGDRSCSYQNYQDQYALSLSAVLCFSLTGKLMAVPTAVHSIPRTSELLPYCLLHWEIGRSRALWLWLRIQMDFLNLGIWAALLNSVSNGTGPSLRDRVRVRTELLPNWRSGLLTHPNWKFGYGSMQISQPVCIGRVVSGLPSRSICRFI